MDGRLTIIFILLAFFIIIVLLGINEAKKYNKDILERVKREYGKKRKISDKNVRLLSHHRESLLKNYHLDSITCNDIDIKKIFSSINHTRSSIGQEYLFYQILRGRLESQELKDFDSLTTFFSDSEELRFSLLAQYEKLGMNSKIDIDRYFSINKAGEDARKVSVIPHIICFVLYIIAAILLVTYTGPGIVLLIISIVVGIYIYFKTKIKMAVFLDSAFYLIKLLEAGKKIGELSSKSSCSVLNNLSDDVLSINHKLKSALRGYSYVSLSSSDNRNVLSTLFIYINMIFHIDILLFYGIDKRLSKREDDIRNLYDDLGLIEAALSIDSYRASLNTWTRPEFSEEYIIEELYHPLIEKAVKNDVNMTRSILITGANASGKSTFLKGVAAAVIMGQTICTVCAKKYILPHLRVYSSMAISDNIQDGDSFFMAEVKSLKRIIDATETQGDRVICFVDEILKGTNTIERIAASSEVTKSLIENGVLCVFASHDIELCSLLDEYVENVHFEEADCVDKEDVYFTYKLMNGPTNGKNAIKLLGRLGVNSDLVKKAKIMADRFEETKEWVLE